MLLTVDSAAGQNLDIVLSSRWYHPTNSIDTLSTLSAINDFKAERLDWIYCDNIDQLQHLKALNLKYSLTLNPQVPDSGIYTTKSMRMVNLNGIPYIAPWMVGWKITNPYWGCVNNPSFKKLFIREGKNNINLGAYGIMVDDAKFNIHAIEWGGGCFCEFCVYAFTTYLISHGHHVSSQFNYKNYLKDQTLVTGGGDLYKNLYKEFQTVSVIQFIKEWQAAMNSYSTYKVVFLTNNYGGKWDSVYKLFDVGISEIEPTANAFDDIPTIIKEAARNKKKQIFSYASENMSDNYKFYLLCYLYGAEALVPWDLWIKPPKKHDRLFSEASDLDCIITFIKTYRKEFYKCQEIPVTLSSCSFKEYYYAKYFKPKDGKTFLILISKSSKVEDYVKAEICNCFKNKLHTVKIGSYEKSLIDGEFNGISIYTIDDANIN
jgi:hypothetical protein